MPISVGVEKARGLESDHSTGHFQIKLFGQKGILMTHGDTPQLPHCDILFYLLFYFILLCERSCRGRGCIWRGVGGWNALCEIHKKINKKVFSERK